MATLDSLSLVDESDVACNLLWDIKSHSDYAVHPANNLRASQWRTVCKDVVCGPGEEIQMKNMRVMSRQATAIVAWLKCVRDTEIAFTKKNMAFQPFQNLITMDFLVYLTQKVCPTELDDVIYQCKGLLGLNDITSDEIREIQRRYSVKHSVYIVPRRHGKTSLLIALIAATVLFVENIVIGYGCHRLMPLQDAYMYTLDTVRKMRAMYGEGSMKVMTTKNKSIRLHNKDTRAWSSILFILLQNDKVCS